VAPTSGFCNAGTPSSVTGSGPWSWKCTGANGGSDASCSAPKQGSGTNGQCGSANGVPVTAAPSSKLCSAGTPSSVSGTGPWTWTCAGANGGTTASCSAPVKSTTGDIATNLQAAGRLTDWAYAGVPGGIPSRTKICATFSPGAKASAITAAINACDNGVVYLNAGTYSAASLGGGIELYKDNVTLRGAGADQTILTGCAIVTLGNGYNSALGRAITGGATKGSRVWI